MMPETLDTALITSKLYQSTEFLSALRYFLPTGIEAPTALGS